MIQNPQSSPENESLPVVFSGCHKIGKYFTRVFPISLFSQVRGLIRRGPSSRWYVVPAFARTNPTISYSEQVKEGNFDCKALDFNEIGVLRVLTSMKDDPYLALSFLKRIEGNVAFLPSVQAYATVIRIVCGWGLDQKLDTFLVELVRKGDAGRGFSVMDLLKAVGEAEEEGKGSLLLLSRLSSALVKAYANLEIFDQAIDIFFQTSPLGCAPDIKALNFLMNRMLASGENNMAVASFMQTERLGLDADAHNYVLVVQALCRNEDTKGVEKLLCRLLNSETRNPCVFYLNFIEGLCLNQMTGIAYLLLQSLRDANLLKEAYALFKRMKTTGIKPDVVTCTVLINIPKLDTKREMKAFDVKPDIVYYPVLIAQQCKVQDLLEAERIFAEMIESGLVPDVVPDTALIAGCCRNGFIHKAVTLMQEMWEKGIEPTKAFLSAVHYAILKAKRLRSRK